MNKIVVLAAVAAVAMSGGVAMARPQLVGVGKPGAHLLTPKKSPGVLYSQTADNSGIGIVSQMFESAYAAYDSQGADDFVVPKGSKWTITEVDASGEYFNGSGPATSENVTFYKDSKGAPGKVVKTITATGKDSSGSFAISLGKGVKLKAGTYWVSVQANLAFTQGGEWGWNTTTTQQTGKAADWENPGDGFGTGCTTYKQEDVCIAAGQGPDQIFVLKGKG